MKKPVFLVRQDIDYLKGDYLVAAVVVADNTRRAKTVILRHCRDVSSDEVNIRIEFRKLHVLRLGEVEFPLPAHGINSPGTSPILSMSVGVDHDL